MGTTVVENTKHGKEIPYRRLPREVRAVARGAAVVFVLDSEEEEEGEEKEAEKEEEGEERGREKEGLRKERLLRRAILHR